jgi:glycosyltransferase involved in cell wall biosynthesis
MKIAYILKRFPRLSETFVIQELLELQRLGVPVQVFSSADPREEEPGRPQHAFFSDLKIPVTYLPHWKQIRKAVDPSLVAQLWPRHGLYERPGSSAEGKRVNEEEPRVYRPILRAIAVAETIREQKIQHLHAHFASEAATIAMLASLLTGASYSFTAHAKDIYDVQDLDAALVRQKIREARFVITVTEYNRRYLQELSGESNGHIIRLYNGVDLQQLTPAAEDRRERDLILAAGRLVEKKGFRYLIEACGLLRDRGLNCRCQIVGDGPEGPALEQEITARNLTDRVLLCGPKPREDVMELMSRAAVFALPAVVSHSNDRDALPTVLLEALALGLPVISTEMSGIPEIIEHRNEGLLVPERNARELASAIEELLIHPELCRRLAAEGRKKAEREFDVSKNVAQLHNIFLRGAPGLTRESWPES